jgi:acylphosphatase
VAPKAKAKRFYISGTVQGVGFRYFVQRVAARLNLNGYVKNLRDGRVEVYAIGAADAFSKLRAELERGPRGAMVSDVAEEDADAEDRYAYEFTIESDYW